MTARCPAGHDSIADDYCDDCGRPIALAGAAPGSLALDDHAETGPVTSTEPLTEPRASSGERCPRCDTPRAAGGRYCEVDGYDFVAPAASWTLTVLADRAHYERIGATDVPFPTGFVERRFEIRAEQTTIGRSRPTQRPGPDVDLSGDPEDPGISARHLRLTCGDDGRLVLTDLGSTNGTTVNGRSTPVDPHVAVSLASGDRISIGAWTTLVVTGAAPAIEPTDR